MSNHYDPESEEQEAARIAAGIEWLGQREQIMSNLEEQQEAGRKVSSDVTRPAHYGGESNPFEPIKIIEHYQLGFHLGNAIKYLLRAPLKGSYRDDLAKAAWYLQREIERAEP